MTWRDSLKLLVLSRQDSLIDPVQWARTFGLCPDEVTLALAEERTERDEIDGLKNPIEAGGD